MFLFKPNQPTSQPVLYTYVGFSVNLNHPLIKRFASKYAYCVLFICYLTQLSLSGNIVIPTKNHRLRLINKQET